MIEGAAAVPNRTRLTETTHYCQLKMINTRNIKLKILQVKNHIGLTSIISTYSYKGHAALPIKHVH